MQIWDHQIVKARNKQPLNTVVHNIHLALEVSLLFLTLISLRTGSYHNWKALIYQWKVFNKKSVDASATSFRFITAFKSISWSDRQFLAELLSLKRPKLLTINFALSSRSH
jgi:hypothetical protein